MSERFREWYNSWKINRRMRWLEIAAQFFGGDFDVRVQAGSEYAITYHTDPPTITIPEEDLIEQSWQYNLGAIMHEGAHRDITWPSPYGYESESERFLHNAIEDIRVNKWSEIKFPGGRRYMKELYHTAYPIDVTEPFDDLATPLNIQFGFGVIYHWLYQTEHPAIKNDAVLKALVDTREAVEEAHSSLPGTIEVTRHARYLDVRSVAFDTRRVRLPVIHGTAVLGHPDINAIHRVDEDSFVLTTARGHEEIFELTEGQTRRKTVTLRPSAHEKVIVSRAVATIIKDRVLPVYRELVSQAIEETRVKTAPPAASPTADNEALDAALQEQARQSVEEKSRDEADKLKAKIRMEPWIKDLPQSSRSFSDDEAKHVEDDSQPEPGFKVEKEEEPEVVGVLEVKSDEPDERARPSKAAEENGDGDAQNELSPDDFSLGPPVAGSAKIWSYGRRNSNQGGLVDALPSDVVMENSGRSIESNSEHERASQPLRDDPDFRERFPPIDFDPMSATQRKLQRKKIEFELQQKFKQSERTYLLLLRPILPLVDQLLGILMNELEKDARPRYKGDYATGSSKINLRKAMSMKKTGDFKIWLRRIKPTKHSFKVCLVLDESGSMGSEGKTLNALNAMVLMMEICSRLDIDFSIIGFSDSSSVHKHFDTKLRVNNRDEILDEMSDFLLRGGGTNDAEAVQTAIEQIEEQDSESKIIIVVTDGYGNLTTRREILEQAKAKSIAVIGLGVGPAMTYVAQVYRPYLVVETIEQVPMTLAKLMIDVIVHHQFAPAGIDTSSADQQTFGREHTGVSHRSFMWLAAAASLILFGATEPTFAQAPFDSETVSGISPSYWSYIFWFAWMIVCAIGCGALWFMSPLQRLRRAAGLFERWDSHPAELASLVRRFGVQPLLRLASEGPTNRSDIFRITLPQLTPYLTSRKEFDALTVLLKTKSGGNASRTLPLVSDLIGRVGLEPVISFYGAAEQDLEDAVTVGLLKGQTQILTVEDMVFRTDVARKSGSQASHVLDCMFHLVADNVPESELGIYADVLIRTSQTRSAEARAGIYSGFPLVSRFVKTVADLQKSIELLEQITARSGDKVSDVFKVGMPKLQSHYGSLSEFGEYGFVLAEIAQSAGARSNALLELGLPLVVTHMHSAQDLRVYGRALVDISNLADAGSQLLFEQVLPHASRHVKDVAVWRDHGLAYAEVANAASAHVNIVLGKTFPAFAAKLNSANDIRMWGREFARLGREGGSNSPALLGAALPAVVARIHSLKDLQETCDGLLQMAADAGPNAPAILLSLPSVTPLINHYGLKPLVTLVAVMKKDARYVIERGLPAAIDFIKRPADITNKDILLRGLSAARAGLVAPYETQEESTDMYGSTSYYTVTQDPDAVVRRAIDEVIALLHKTKFPRPARSFKGSIPALRIAATLPENIVRFLDFLKSHSLSNVALIGGAPRDVLLGREPDDLDVTFALPLSVEEKELNDITTWNAAIAPRVFGDLERLARALNLSVADFIGGKGSFEGELVHYAGPFELRVQSGETVRVDRSRLAVVLSSAHGLLHGLGPIESINSLAILPDRTWAGNKDAIRDLENRIIDPLASPYPITLTFVLRQLMLKFKLHFEFSARTEEALSYFMHQFALPEQFAVEAARTFKLTEQLQELFNYAPRGIIINELQRIGVYPALYGLSDPKIRTLLEE